MRIVRIPDGVGERGIAWYDVQAIRFSSEGARRWLTLTYRGGGEKRLEPHQALELWHDVNEKKQKCEFPCYFYHDLDTPPEACRECQLAANLEGLGVKVRPAKVPAMKRIRWRISWVGFLGCVVFFLLYLVGYLTWALIQRIGEAPPPPDKESPKSAPLHRSRSGSGVG